MRRILCAAALGALVFAAPALSATEVASSYSPADSGGDLACTGKRFDWTIVEAASRTLACGTRLVITYGGRSLVVPVEDRGPYVYTRQLDLSVGAVRVLLADPGASADTWGVRTVQVSLWRAPKPRVIHDAKMVHWRWVALERVIRSHYARRYWGALWEHFTVDQPDAYAFITRVDPLP